MTTTIGIVFGDFAETPQEILSYLLIFQNTLQSSFEFRILPTPDDDFIRLLSSEQPPNHAEVEEKIDRFLFNLRTQNNSAARAYGLDPVAVDKVILLTDTALSDNYYYVGTDTWAVIALGGWEDAYAPPSIVEYYLSCVVVAALDAKVDLARHYETRGCITDFNAGLADARFSVLSGYICHNCAQAIKEQASKKLLDDVHVLLDRRWLGDSSAPSEVALTIKKMGYDLFRTSGIKPNWKETIRATLEQEGLKNFLSVTFQILLAIALLVLGLKSKN